jgi:hypothetical protein
VGGWVRVLAIFAASARTGGSTGADRRLKGWRTGWSDPSRASQPASRYSANMVIGGSLTSRQLACGTHGLTSTISSSVIGQGVLATS